MYIVFVDLSLDVIFGRPLSLLLKLWPLVEFICTYQRLMQIGINNLLWLSAQTLAQTSVIPPPVIHSSELFTRWKVVVSSFLEAKNVMEHQLSSPSTSYEFECTPTNI